MFRFSIGWYVMDQRSGDGRFSGWIKVIAINSGLHSFPEFWDAGGEDCVCSEQDHPEFLLQEKGQSGGTESSETGSQALMVPFLITLIYSLLFFKTIMFRNSIRDGMKFYYPWPRAHLMMSWKVFCNTWVWSTQNCVGIVRHGNSWENIDAWLAKVKKMVKRSIDQKLRFRNFDARNEKMKTGAVDASRTGLSGIAKRTGRVCCQWKAKGQCSRGDQCSFRQDGDERAKPTQKTAPPSEPPTQRGRSASRERNLRDRSPSGKFDQQPCKNFLKCVCTFSLCDYWHPPKCQFFRFESGCKFGDKCSLAHRQVEEQPNRRPKKGGDKRVVAILKDARQLGCVFQDTEPPESLLISRKSTKVLGSIRRLRCTKATQRHANIRENKGPSLGQIHVKVPLQRSPNATKFEDRSQEETERQERCARGHAWRLAKNILKLKQTDKAIFFSPTNEWCLPAPSARKPCEREFVVDSGASMHCWAGKTWTLPNWKPQKTPKIRRWLSQTTARCWQEKKLRCMSKNGIHLWQ